MNKYIRNDIYHYYWYIYDVLFNNKLFTTINVW